MMMVTENTNLSELRNLLVSSFVLLTNNIKDITNTLGKLFGGTGYISIDKQLNPLLIKIYENTTAFNPSKCNNIGVTLTIH